ncbi:MAG: DUF1616 domain-containing protein [Anaerolineales bacterium]|nr:DUF1616 domain-containing protein [Anaerolineales bacterium]
MKRYFDLVGILLVTAVQLIFVYFDLHGPVRVVTGFLFVALLPGYALLAGFYRPYRPRFHMLEHIALAIPLSLALNTIVGLTLNLVGLGLRPGLQVIWMSSITLIGVGWAWTKTTAHVDLMPQAWGILVSVIAAAALLNFATFSVEPNGDDTFVSLYVVDEQESISMYPSSISVGEPFTLIVGGEYRGKTAQSFRLMSNTVDEPELLMLEPGMQWERPFTLTLSEPGRHLLSWELYQSETTTPARTVRIWVNVTS